MSENLNPFDKHFRQRLTDVESSVPDDLFDRLQARRGAALPSDAPLRERLSTHETPVSDVIFDAVLAERKRQKRRRIVLWRSATAIAAALLLLFVAIELKIKNEELKTRDSKISAFNSELDNTNKPVSNNLKKQQIIINKKADLNKNKNANSNLKIAKTQSNNAIASAISDKLGNKNAELKHVKNAKISENTEGPDFELKTSLRGTKQKKSKLSNVNFDANNVSNNKFSGVNPIANNVVNSELKNNNSQLNSNKTIGNNLDTEGPNFELKIKNSELNTANLELKTALENRLASPNFQTPTLDFLHILSVKTVALPTVNRKNPCSDPGNGCPTFIGRRRMNHISYYVDAFVAPEYMMRRFKTNLPESEKLLAARDSNEKVQYAVSTGVRGSVVFGNGISLRAGVVFNQMNERVQFDSFGIGSIKTTYDVRIVSGKPDTVSVTTVITDGIFRQTRYNRYRSIDIPLQIGYQMRMKNGWTFGVNGGANVNITAWRKADIFGANLQKKTVSSGINEANPVFRNQLGISLIGSVAAYRQLTNSLELMIEPSVRYGLQPITRSDYALKQQYSTAGLIVGLRLRL